MITNVLGICMMVMVVITLVSVVLILLRAIRKQVIGRLKFILPISVVIGFVCFMGVGMTYTPTEESLKMMAAKQEAEQKKKEEQEKKEQEQKEQEAKKKEEEQKEQEAKKKEEEQKEQEAKEQEAKEQEAKKKEAKKKEEQLAAGKKVEGEKQSSKDQESEKAVARTEEQTGNLKKEAVPQETKELMGGENNPMPIENEQAQKQYNEAEKENDLLVEEDQKEQESKIPTEKPIYEIALMDDTNVARAIRINLYVVVKNPEVLNKENFEEMSRNIVESYIKDHSVNALTVYFFNSEEEIGHAYTVGMCTYYPNGTIGDALYVKAGDYSTFEYNFEF